MKIMTSVVPVLLVIFAVAGCGFLGNMGIVVKVDDINTTMTPKTAVADSRSESFAVASYELNADESDLSEDGNLRKPSEEEQILITFKVNRSAGGADVERGSFSAENISWFHVYYFKDGNVQKKVLKNIEGKVIVPRFTPNEDEVLGAIDVTDGNTSLKGAFTAKKITG